MRGAFGMAWKEVEYSRNQIKKAGSLITKETITEDEKAWALKVIDNWRAAHAYPLYVVSKKIREISKTYNSLTVYRLKRLNSIIDKLGREDHMSLYRMQDLGGCRVIVPTINDVYTLANAYENSRIRHELYKENDYIKFPKDSGYRCLHRVYKYRSQNSDSCYNNMMIEIQFRTQLQHLWATAIETMGIFTKSNLKASMGEKHILRFFALVSALFADAEGIGCVPCVDCNIENIKTEIIDLDKRYYILETLNTVKHAIQGVNTIAGNNKYFLLKLDYKTHQLHIRGFKSNALDLATEQYGQLESDDDPNINVVLVSAESFEIVQRAYPNYFLDISKFIKQLQLVMQNKRALR